MSNLFELYIAYEREIAIILQILPIVIAIATLIVSMRINKKLKKIIKEISIYLNCIIDTEEEEQKKKEITENRTIQEEQSELISKVLEEIFP